eukprot:s473_g16.t1
MVQAFAKWDHPPSSFLELALAQAWYDMRPDHCQARTWSGEPPDPFWHNRPRSPIRSIPGAASPTIARPDVLHCFNLGVGSDLAAGALIAMCRMKLFPGRSIQSRLDEAFDRFSGWCSANNKSAAIPCFELKKFKMSSLNTWPKGPRKGHDTALLFKWLGSELNAVRPDMVAAVLPYLVE